MEKIVRSIVSQINQKIEIHPEIAIVLGSGLSDIVDCMDEKIIIPYNELEGMLQTKVEGHKNQFIVGKLAGKNVIAMQGRFHLYDGFSAKQVAMPIYIFKELGVKTLILTNAAGGVKDDMKPGDIAVICDHINNTATNCMIGGPIIDYGTQFVDMSEPYNNDYIQIVENIAKKESIKLCKGTYMQFLGPFYETKADIIMAKRVGADIVGMSTAVEVEAANHCGLKVLALSVITNKATGLSTEKNSHKDVLKASFSASKKLIKIVQEFVNQL